MRRSLWPLALGLLLVLDIALVAWVLRPSSPTSGDAAAPTTSSIAPPTTSASTSTTTTAPKVDRTIVVPLGAQRALRVVTGADCKGSATLSTTEDAGATWKPGPRLPLKMVSSATSNTAGHPVLTGLDGSCKAATVEVNGQRIGATDPAAWAVDASEPAFLLRAGEKTAKACASGTVRDLAWDTTERANVLCEAGVIRRSTDGGRTWVGVGTVQGATGIATAATGFELYVAAADTCGIRVAPVGQQGTCAEASQGMKDADITIWGRWLWVADTSKGFVVPVGRAAVDGPATTSSTAPSVTSTTTTAPATEATSTSETPAPSSTPEYTQPAYTQPAYTAPADTATTRTAPRWTPPATTRPRWTSPATTQQTPPPVTETTPVPTDPTASIPNPFSPALTTPSATPTGQ